MGSGIVSGGEPVMPYMVKDIRRAGFTWMQARRARLVKGKNPWRVCVFDGRITRSIPAVDIDGWALGVKNG